MEALNIYLSFRIRQLGRFLLSIGIGYILLILILLSGIFLRGLSNILVLEDHNIYVGVAILFSILFAQRSDTRFLRSTDMNLTLIFLVDALLIGIPICFGLCIASRFNAALGVLASSIVVPIIWVRVAPTFKISESLLFDDIDLPFLSSQDFELKYLFRRFIVFFGLIYMITLIMVMQPASLIVMAFLWMALLQTVFEYYEPKELILENEKSNRFLRNKFFRICKVVQLMLIPFYVFGVFFSPSLWYLYILIFLSVTVMLSFIVFNKYAFYRPGVKRMHTNTIASVMLLFLLIPGFQLVVLIMSIKQYFKAKKNLSFYQRFSKKSEKCSK